MLYICPTPLGNLGDITVRTQEVLRACDVVCAEDTRVTGKLLAAYGIEKRLERLDENMMARGAAGVVDRVLAGETIAYCSDAGMPGVSDPGLRLVHAAQEAGAPVCVLPGPTAAATAYVASGFACTSFFFGGFLPRRDAERVRLLESLRAVPGALIFYESPNRLVDALACIAQVFPLREAAVCRELTKLHEEVVRANACDLAQEFADRASIKGEIAIVIDGPNDAEEQAGQAAAQASAEDRARELAQAGMRGKQIAKELAAEFGLARNIAYDIAVEAARSARDGAASDAGDAGASGDSEA